jgi:hypothetical protein
MHQVVAVVALALQALMVVHRVVMVVLEETV